MLPFHRVHFLAVALIEHLFCSPTVLHNCPRLGFKLFLAPLQGLFSPFNKFSLLERLPSIVLNEVLEGVLVANESTYLKFLRKTPELSDVTLLTVLLENIVTFHLQATEGEHLLYVANLL